MQQNIHLSMPSEECRWCCYASLCLSLTWSGDMGESLSFMFVLQPQSLSLSAPLSLKCVIAMWNYISTLTHTPCLMFPFTLLNNTLGGARKKKKRDHFPFIFIETYIDSTMLISQRWAQRTDPFWYTCSSGTLVWETCPSLRERTLV